MSKVLWRKASQSTENGGNCIEVALTAGAVAVRDSKDPSGPRLIIDRPDFRSFAETLKHLQVN